MYVFGAFLVQMRENTDKKTPNTDNLTAVVDLLDLPVTVKSKLQKNLKKTFIYRTQLYPQETYILHMMKGGN